MQDDLKIQDSCKIIRNLHDSCMIQNLRDRFLQDDSKLTRFIVQNLQDDSKLA